MNGGVARMSSFGEGIQMTPLELGSLVATVANGGTMYYLQYPRSEEALHNFEPRVKRQLDISPFVSEVRDGMEAAVLYGTARLSYDHEGEQPLGKTGTCSDSASRLGWFASYADQEHPRIVLVILMRGQSSTVKGPFAGGDRRPYLPHAEHGQLFRRPPFGGRFESSFSTLSACVWPSALFRPC